MAQLTVERIGAVAIVTITNPPMGYMDSGTVPELDAVTQELAADDGVRAVVLTGGLRGVFIRHYSVIELEALAPPARPGRHGRHRLTHPGARHRSRVRAH